MIVGNIALQDIDRIYRDARIAEPFIFVYRGGDVGLIQGLVTGYFEDVAPFGRVCVFHHVIVTKHAVDRAAVKNDMAIFAIRAALAAPAEAVLTCVEKDHPLHDMLVEWTKSLGGISYYTDGEGKEWFYTKKEFFHA